MNRLSKDDLEARLTTTDRKQIFEALGVNLEKGTAGQDGWVNGLYMPASISSDTNPSFCINLETGAVKDHGSDYSGDIWTLIQDVKSSTFSDALEWVASSIGYANPPAVKWNPFTDGELKETYSYEDEAGGEVFQVLRFEVKAGHIAYPAKTFRQRHYDRSNAKAKKDGFVWQKAKKQVPYRLPQILKVANEGGVVFIVEGEKDVHTLEEVELCGTCNAGGAGKWQPHFANHFKGVHVVILPDNDPQGKQHAEAVAGSLSATVKTLRILELPELPQKGDITDWINSGHTVDELKELAKNCPIWVDVSNDAELDEEEEIGVLVSTVEREKIKWLWPGRLALGKLSILDGDPGLGKSTLYCEITARITTGRGWPDDEEFEGSGLYADPSSARDVVIVTCEDGIGDTIRPRLEEAGADLDRCRVVQVIPYKNKKGERLERVPSLPEDIPAIEKAVKQSSATLLVIDPLFAHLSSNVNSYRDQDIRGALTPVVHMAERLGVALLVVRHLNKAPGGSAIYRGGGSIGIIGQARLAMLLGKNPEDDEALVLASTKANIGKKSPSLALRVVSSDNDKDVGVIQWEGESAFAASDLLAIPKAAKNRAVDEAAEWLRAQLQDGQPHMASDMWQLSEEAGLKEKTVRRALKEIGVIVEQVPNKPGGIWFWSLPDNSGFLIQSSHSKKLDLLTSNSPDGHFPGIDHLATDEGEGAIKNIPHHGENDDLFSSPQMAKVNKEEEVGHLANQAVDLAPKERFESAANPDTAFASGTTVRLPDGREGTVTPSWQEDKVGVFLFYKDETVFAKPESLTALYTSS